MTRPTKPAAAFRAIWPITDPTMTLDELRVEALADLPRLLDRAHAEVVGRIAWCIRPGSDVPGSGGAHLVLVATAPARPATGTGGYARHLAAMAGAA